MSRRQSQQSGEGIALEYPGIGVLQKIDTVAPTNGAIGYAPGCTWVNVNAVGNSMRYVNIGGNGFGTNATATWLIDDQSSANQTQFGSGTATIFAGGNIYRNAPSVALNPGSTHAVTAGAPGAGDFVVDFYTLPANSLDGTGFRTLAIQAGLLKANNGNHVDAKIIIGSTLPVIGGALTTGTTIAEIGDDSTAAQQGLFLSTQVWKTGAKNSNTQIYQETATIQAATHGGCGVPAALTLTENAAIYIAVTLTAATTATDIGLWWWEITANN